MRINRPILDAALVDFALSGHGLVLGRPGVGKTFSLAQLGRSLNQRDIPYLFVAVQELGMATEEEVRASLGYEGLFTDELQGLFESTSQGVLIIDGYDAARDEQTRLRVLAYVRWILRHSPPGWSLIVSVRNYDAARSPTLVELFRPVAHTGTAAAFQRLDVRARHFAIPELTTAEVEDAVLQIGGFEQVFEKASGGLRNLLRVPFNMWLVERIMREVEDPQQIGVLESEAQLLALFWSIQVARAPDGDGRIAVLGRVTHAMVAAKRLAVPKAAVYDPNLEHSWRGLFSSEVLTSEGSAETRVAYGHNILFDYAVSVFEMDAAPGELAEFLNADSSRPLFLRPSLIYLFTRLWYEQRAQFWKTFWVLLDEESVPVRLVGRLLPPYVAANEANILADLTPLAEHYHANRNNGAAAVLRVLQATRFVTPRVLSPWLELARELANEPDRVFAWELGQFLKRALERAGDNRSIIGEAGRALMGWIWTERDSTAKDWFDAFGAGVVLPLVLATYDTDTETSTAIIQRIMGLLGEDDFPIGYISNTADAITDIARHSPATAAEFYTRVFGHVETSESPTNLGGIVLRLTSNRRQDFSMCHYVLAKEFPAFFDVAPKEALAAGVDVLNHLAIQRHVLRYLNPGYKLEDVTQRFEFRGKQRVYVRDYSVSWMQGGRDEEVDIANHLVSCATSAPNGVTEDTIVAIYSDHAIAGAAWAKLLEIGIRAPGRYAELLHELVLARPIQLGSDTLQILGTFIEKASLHWSDEQRRQLEESLLSLPADAVAVGGSDAEYPDHIRNRLLACIPESQLVTAAGRARVKDLKTAGTLPTNDALVSFTMSSRTWGADDWLTERGVDLQAPENEPLNALARTLEEFSSRWSNDRPDAESVRMFTPTIKGAHDQLRTYETLAAEDLHRKGSGILLEHTWSKLAAAARAVAHTHPGHSNPEYVVVRSVLLDASQRPKAELGQKAELEYTSPWWSPNVHTEAIQGLAFLTWRDPDEDVSRALAAYAVSQDPAERYLTFRYGGYALANTALSLFWDTLAPRVAHEQNDVVLAAILDALRYGLTSNADRAELLVRDLLSRRLGTSNDELRRDLADWLVYYVVWKDRPWAWELVSVLRADVLKFGKTLLEVHAIAVSAFVTPSALRTKSKEECVPRAVKLLRDSMEALIANVPVTAMALANQQDDASDRVEIEHRLVHNLVLRIEVAARKAGEGEEEVNLEAIRIATDPRDLRRYYETVRPLLADVLRYNEAGGVVGVRVPNTTHDFMELLNRFLPYDPVGVLNLAVRAVGFGAESGYVLDSMAVRETVKMVELVLAEYRDRITSGQPLDDILRLLDFFADAGWPDALRLVWRLDEVFR